MKILLTSARSQATLELARLLHAAGHEVYAADTTYLPISRFSNAVKSYFTIPSPRFDRAAFKNALIEIVQSQAIELLIPIYEETLYLAAVKDYFPKSCTLFCPSFELIHQLHHKWLFHQLLTSLNIPALSTYFLQSPDDLKQLQAAIPYAIKAVYSRGSQHVKKYCFPNPIDLPDITPEHPFVAQAWLEGKKYCSYSICNKGKLTAHALYPVGYAIGGTSCIAFEQVRHQAILDWTERLVQQIDYTGQISFDFIDSPEKGLFAIECNPRATSGIHLFQASDKIDRAFLSENCPTILPTSMQGKQIALGMLLYGWRKSSFHHNSFSKFFKTYSNNADVVYSASDIKPFLAQPLAFAAIWFNCWKYGLSLSSAFTHDIEWNGP